MFIFSCEKKRNVDLSGNKFSPPIPIEELTARNELENKAFLKINQFLTDNSLDSFFVVSIVFPDKNQLEVKDVADAVEFIGLEIVHATTVIYWDSLERQNKHLQKQSQDKEWPLIIPPITGNVSGKDRTIFYYFKNDSIIDLLQQ